jgi:hypothetical protein
MMAWMGSASYGEHEERNRVSSYRGYLLKMRRANNVLAPQWGKRWFSIEGRYFRWYRLDTDLVASGMIDLRHVRSITKVDINGAFTFCVTCEDRNLIMRASSVTEMNGWIRALHMQADIARGGTGMTLVSDFNEPPFSHSMQFSRKTPRSRGSLTLEQQLDLNLQKLNELELEVLSQGDETSPSAARYGHSADSKYSEEDEDGLNDMQFFSGGQGNNRSKAGKLRQSSQNRNPLAEAPSQHWRAAGASRHVGTGDFPRTESTESFDNHHVAPSRGCETYGAYSGGYGGSSGEYAAKASAAQYNIPSRRGSKGSTGTAGEDEPERRSFDSDYGHGEAVRRKVPVHTGGRHMPTTASIYVNPTASAPAAATYKATPKQQQQQYVRKRATSSDSLDSVEFSYIPDISEEGAGHLAEQHGAQNSKGSGRGCKPAWG